MPALTRDNPIIQEAYAELQRFYADNETREKIRERERFLRDYELGMNASKAEGQARTIVHILTYRFHSVSEAVQTKLFSLFDIELLDRLTALALKCDTLEEFASKLP